MQPHEGEEPGLFEQLEAGVVAVAADGAVVVWNAAAERMLGLAAERALGRRWSEVAKVLHGGVMTVREVLEAARLPGGWHGLAEVQVVDQPPVAIRVHLQRVEARELSGRGYMAVFWPARVRSPRLRSLPKHDPLPYGALFQRSEEPLALSDLAGVLLDANEAAGALFGYEPAEVIGRRVALLLDGWTDEVHAAARDELMAGGSFVRRSTALPKTGERFPIELTGTLVSSVSGEYVVVRMRDLSHERHLERMLDDLGDLARLGEEPIELEVVARRAVEIVAQTFEADASVLLLAEPGQLRAMPGPGTPEAAVAAFASARDGGRDEPAASPLTAGAPAASPLTRAVLDAGRPLEIELTGHPPALGAGALSTLGYRSLQSAPLRLGGRNVGAFVLLSRTAPRHPLDVRRLEHMGRLAGVAIGNAELRDEMRREAAARAHAEEGARVGGVVVAQMTDSIVTIGADRVITTVNPATERQYGFSAAEAVGRSLCDVMETLRLDGTRIGDEILTEASSVGYWHGRVVHRPKVGAEIGRQRIVELSLTALRDEAGRPGGLIALSQDVTASARLEAEAAALSSLAVATGRARSRREVAEAALERLCEATTSEVGIIASYDGDQPSLDAAIGLTGVGERIVHSLDAVTFAALVDEAGPIVSMASLGRVESLRWLHAAISGAGMVSGTIVALRVHGRPIGYVGLASPRADWERPSDEVLFQAAGQVANALENSRLMERLERGLEQERRITAQLETLMGLTQLPSGPITEQSLAQFLLQRVIGALDAESGFVVKVIDGRFQTVASHDVPDSMRELIELNSPSYFYFWRRFEQNLNSFFVSLDDAAVAREVRQRLSAFGYTSYAAFPIRDGAALSGAFVCHFSRPHGELPADNRTIEAVGRSINIAYANIRLGEGLAEAAEHERRLTAELRALQELTLLGATSDDLGRLARETMEAIVLATGATSGGYLLVDPIAGVLEPLVWAGAAPWAGGEPEWAFGLVGAPDLATGSVALSRAAEASGVPRAGQPHAEAQLPLLVDDELAGVIQLEWVDPPRSEEFDRHFLDPIARIASISLANFRLRSELLQRAAAQRALGQRLDALDELTRIGEEATSFEELAHRTANLVREALGASGVCYLLVGADALLETHAIAGDVADFGAWLAGVAAAEAPGGAALLSGAGSVLGEFAADQVSPEALALAERGAARSFGAIPIRIAEELAGALVCFFERAAAELPIDQPALDSVARIAGIALANFRLRERLVLSEERYRTLFEESPDAFLVSAFDGTVLDANEAAVRLYRVERGDVLGRYFGELVFADEREMVRRREIVWSEGRGTFRDRGRRPDGSEFPIELETRVVELDGQRRFLSLVRDLSDQERLQRELLQAQKMEALGQLVSGVAHELNNPLAAIIAFSQLLRGDPRLPEDMKHDAGLLVQEADRTRRIVQNLLDFARQRPPERRPTRIATLVQSVFELQSYALTTNRIEVILDIPESLPEVDLDRAQLQQVLLNLTINAIQAIRGREGGGPAHLWVTASLVPGRDAGPAPARAGAAVRIAIRDDGPGVPETARARLFDPFFTTKQPGEGTGLGLSVSFGIIAAHDGHLWYEPGPGGVGSRFIIELPVRAHGIDERRLVAALDGTGAGSGGPAPAVAVRASAATAGAPGGRPEAPDGRAAAPDGRAWSPDGRAGADARAHAPDARSHSPYGRPEEAAARPDPERGRVLVLDDEPSIRVFLRKALTVAGLDCVPFQDGGQALDHLASQPCDVMLIDHRMAGMSGTEFYDAAVRLRPELANRAIFMSGDVLNPDLRGFATQRGIRLLAKPFDIDAAIRVVREALGPAG